MRKKIVAGNWKMNKNLSETGVLLSDLKTILKKSSKGQVIVAPASINLHQSVELLKSTEIKVAAQNMHQSVSGAYTGEVSSDMLKDIGVQIVILGHSERRAYFGETDVLLAEKVTTALDKEMTVIFCFGEELQDRKKENHFSVVADQLKNGIFHIGEKQWKNIILAYEPVWAIGTGETASPEQAQEMHAFIRKTIADAYSQEVADEVSILYGGSVKPNNAPEIFAKPDVDGGLIGGASLDAKSFAAIVEAI